MADTPNPPEPMTSIEADIITKILASIESTNKTQTELANLLFQQEERQRAWKLEAMKALASPVPPAPG